MMPGREKSLGRTVVVIALAAMVGCGGGAASDADTDTAAAAEQEAAPQAQESSAANQSSAEESGPMILTADDIDRYRKGKLAEIDDVKKKAAALSAAKTGDDSLNTLFALSNEGDRAKAGATAAGMEVGNYRRLTSAVDNVLGAWRMSEMMKTQGNVDTATLDAGARARVRENAATAQAGLQKLPESNVKLILPVAAELDSLRLLPPALALKAAGA